MIRQVLTGDPDSVTLAKAEAFAIICDVIPVVFLNPKGEVTDVSERFKSCRGKTADRTVLSRLMNKADFKRLRALCTDAETSEFLPRNELVFDVNFDNFRYGVFYSVSSSKAPVTSMCLISEEYELEFVFALMNGSFPKGLINSYKKLALQSRSPFLYSTLMLFDPGDELNASEAWRLINSLSARMASCNGILTSHIQANAECSGNIPKGVHIKPGPLALMYTSLLHILDNLSQNKLITVNVYTNAEYFEVDMCTDIHIQSNTVLKTETITSLSEILPACQAYLNVSELTSHEAGIYVEGHISNGKVRFIFGTLNEIFPVLEFKYSDTEARFKVLFDNVTMFLRAFTSTLPKEETSEEE